MKTLDFTLNSAKNGGRITDFNYSHSLNELVGSWSATIAGGTFKAGNSISFDNVMKNGIISHAYKDSSGLWHVEGKDAGVQLMKSTPDIDTLPEGNAKTVICYLADFCSISLDMTGNGLSGFNVRSVISGSTCAEAILELAMFSGMIAYINHNGALVIKQPSTSTLNLEDVIDDSESNIDLDGYATQVLVNLNRRKWPDNTNDDIGDEGETVYSGTTPSRIPERVTKSGAYPPMAITQSLPLNLSALYRNLILPSLITALLFIPSKNMTTTTSLNYFGVIIRNMFCSLSLSADILLLVQRKELTLLVKEKV